MKVILTSDDRKLGKKNTIKDVKDGYARFLIDSGKAVVANQNNLKKLENNQREAKKVDEACRKLANKIKNDIESTTFYINKTYNEKTNQLNGSITKNDVLEAVSSRFPIYNFSDSSFIEFPKTKFAQLYQAKIKLYGDIIANITFGIRINR